MDALSWRRYLPIINHKKIFWVVQFPFRRRSWPTYSTLFLWIHICRAWSSLGISQRLCIHIQNISAPIPDPLTISAWMNLNNTDQDIISFSDFNFLHSNFSMPRTVMTNKILHSPRKYYTILVYNPRAFIGPNGIPFNVYFLFFGAKNTIFSLSKAYTDIWQ